MTKPRSINIFLLDGDPNGIRVAQISMSTIQAIAFRRNQLRRVAEGVGCSERAIRKHIVALVAAGLLRKIGKCRGGAQISNVYYLTGWPGRTRLPAGGHPRLGRYVREEALADLLHVLNRHQCPAAAESCADQNKVIEKITATEAEKQAILERCFRTLGPPPFTPDEKKTLAASVYAHVWQQAVNGGFAQAA